MRKLVMMMVLALAAGCGSVDDPPLGGPYGGTTGGTDPNAGQNGSQPATNPGSSGTDASSPTPSPTSTGSTQDASTPPPPAPTGTQDASAPPPPPPPSNAPTWSQIYSKYLSGCKSCHGQCSGASNTYNWLAGRGYMGGSSCALVDPNQSCLTWYGGNMPPSGGANSAAVKDMNAWAAAGALNN